MKIFTNEIFKVKYINNAFIYLISDTNDEDNLSKIFNTVGIKKKYLLNSGVHYSSYSYWKQFNEKSICCSGWYEDGGLITIFNRHILQLTPDEEIDMYDNIERYITRNDKKINILWH